MRKILILGFAAILAVLTLGFATGSANAATANADGSVTVSKGDIQSAMGWNNGAWDNAINATDGVARVGNLITTTGATPVDVPGGWLTLNGQIVADYPNDEYYKSWFTNPENWCNGWQVVESHWTNDANAATVTPIRNSQQKVTGFKVTATPDTDGYVYYTRHTTGQCPEYGGAQFVYHATSRWPASVAGSGVSDVKVGGKAVTVTPAA